MKRFLIVEDHPIFADALALSIRSAMPSNHIEHANTVAQAKAAIYRERGFDLVLLDLWLPDTNGFDGLTAQAVSKNFNRLSFGLCRSKHGAQGNYMRRRGLYTKIGK